MRFGIVDDSATVIYKDFGVFIYYRLVGYECIV